MFDIVEVHNGLGNHIADVPLETLTKYLKVRCSSIRKLASS